MVTKKEECSQEQFFGTTTVGSKGQICIPAEAREQLKLKEGDKLLVFGMGDDMIALTKISHMEKYEKHLSGQLESIRKMMKSNT